MTLTDIYWSAYYLSCDPLVDCPYPVGSKEADVWELGYTDGRRNY